LTANGKLDRRALPAPEHGGLLAAYVAPRTEDEQRLCALVAELLRVPRVGLDDDFFKLGGHSLLATRLVALVRARLKRDLPLRTVFERPRLGELAAALHELPSSDDALPSLTADTVAAYEPFALTPVQEAYWLGRQRLVALSEVACHVYVELKLRELDVERLTLA